MECTLVDKFNKMKWTIEKKKIKKKCTQKKMYENHHHTTFIDKLHNDNHEGNHRMVTL